MAKGYKKDGTPIDLATVFEAIGEFEAGDITAEELNEIECNACPSGGSCSGMFTWKLNEYSNGGYGDSSRGEWDNFSPYERRGRSYIGKSG